jgi:hypothetical protein
VKHSIDIDVPGSAAPGDVAPAPGSLGTRVRGCLNYTCQALPAFHPAYRLEAGGDEVEFACSQVVTTERLRHETLALVDRNILRSIRVGLKKRKKTASAPLASFMHSHPLLCFVSATPVPGQRECSALQVEVT